MLLGAEPSTSGQFCKKVWSIPGMRIEWLPSDLMHMVDLGITQYLSGNICWFLFDALGGRRHGAPLASRAVCAKIREMAEMAAREGGLDRLHNLTVRKFRAQNKPKLALKAADGRHFLPILLKVLQLCPLRARRTRGSWSDASNPCAIFTRSLTPGTRRSRHLASRPWRADTKSCCASCTTRATTRTYGASTQGTTCSCTCASPHSRRGSIRSWSGATVRK